MARSIGMIGIAKEADHARRLKTMSESIATFDGNTMKGELRELVRQMVEDNINALLGREADDPIAVPQTYHNGFPK